jgi:1-acyl-sn-glycerol-3-phosphate acyltransferase
MRSWIYLLISIFVYAVLYAYTAAGVLLILIFSWFHMKKVISVLISFWAKSVFVIIGKKFTVLGKENIVKGEKYILVANHGSLFDITAIMSFYTGISWFGHERLLKIPLFRKILLMTDYVPFKKATVKNTKKMLDQLKQNSKTKTVAIFPEGTRTLDGKINPFYKGFIHLFRYSDLPILPVTLNGFYLLKPKNRFYINFDSKLEVIIHKPISKSELINKTDNEIIEAVKSVIESSYV